MLKRLERANKEAKALSTHQMELIVRLRRLGTKALSHKGG